MKRGKRLTPFGSLLAALGVSTILASPLLAQTITLRGVSNNFVTVDETPNFYSFTSVTNVEPGDVVIASPVVTVAGLGASVPVTVSGQGSPKFRINGGGLVTSGTVDNGDTVELSLQTAAGALNTTYVARLTIGTYGANFSATTRAGDITPDAFAFTNATNAEPGTITATPTITVSGLEGSATASVVGTGTPRLKINGGAPVASGTVSNGSTVQLVLTSATGFETTYNATVTIGNGSASFQATTRAGDVTPDAFSFTSASAAEPGTTVSSNTVTLAGFEGTLPVSVSGSGSPKIKINGGAAVTSGTVSPGDTLAVDVETAAGAFSSTYTANVLVGSASASFGVTTRAADTTPNAFTFTAVTDADVTATVSSNIVTLAGFEVPVAISLSKTGNGTACYKINGGTCGTGASTVSSGDTVQIEVGTTATGGETTVATLDVGGVTGQYSVTTFSNCQTKDLTTLALGASSCSIVNGSERQTTYAGLMSGVRVYVTPMTGSYQWKTAASGTSGSLSTTDGTANTTAHITAGAASHPAAAACRNLGSEWYVPSRDEIFTVRGNKAVGDLTALNPGAGDRFWSSTQNSATAGNGVYVTWSATGTAGAAGITKTTTYPIFCMRR